MAEERYAEIWEELHRRALAEGGFADLPGGVFRPDATAWAALAFGLLGQDQAVAAAARTRLVTAQLDDGRVSMSPEQPAACWPTALALLAWHGSAAHAAPRQRAVGFLLQTSGTHWERTADAAVAHDTALRGWPWTAATHSWVEPTAMSVAALQVSGYGGHPRVAEGVRLLLDRQLADGSWNYGTTTVYGREHYPQLDCTGAALEALAGRVPRAQVAGGLAFLARGLASVRTPLSLAWGLFGLAAWGERPRVADEWLAEAFIRLGSPRQTRTAHLALLLLAAEAAGGLSTLVARSGNGRDA